MKPADALSAYALGREVEREFDSRYGMPLGEFAVLHALAQAEDRRMRMTPLARAAALSPSGLSRMSQRLVRRNLILLGGTHIDARGVYAELTAAGYVAWRDVWHIPDEDTAKVLSEEPAGA